MSAFSRFLNQWRRQSLDGEFDEELRFHLDARLDANVRAGLSPIEAAAEARRHFGSALRAREGMREARISAPLGALRQDLRHGMRMFLRQPGPVALTILTLSLGIGANAAIFSLLHAVLLRPLPFADPDGLVSIQDGQRSVNEVLVTPTSTIPELLALRSRTRTLAGVSFMDTRDFQIDGGSEPARVLGARVEPTLLAMLGMPPQLGRVFRADEGNAGADRVIILSDGLWRRNFGSDPSVVGRQAIINGQASTIIGVMPPAFPLDLLWPEAIDLFVPYPMVPIYTSWTAEFASVRRVTGLARLKPGTSIETASAETRTIAAGIAAQHPQLYSRGSDRQDLGFFMNLESLRESMVAGSRRTLLLLFGAVGLVLMIACLNTAQFLFARSVDRRAELAVRAALGAGRNRLVRQMLAESLLLAGVASIIGILQAIWLTRLLRALLPENAPIVGAVGVDVPVLLFTAGAALVTAVGCGMIPAIRVSRISPGRSFESRGEIASSGRSRQLMIAVEVALSIVLLVGAGLLVRTLQALQASAGGYVADNVTVLRMRGMSAGPALGETYQRYLAQIEGVPDIEAAAIAGGVLPQRGEMSFTITGRQSDSETLARQSASYLIVSPGYFSTLRIPLREGRTLAADDNVNKPAVAVVNRAMAERFWPGGSPLGQQVSVGPGPRSATLTIVGVVGNVRPILQGDDVPQIYVSLLQQSEPSVVLMIRTTPGRAVPVDAVKKAIWSVVPQQAVFAIRPMTEIVSSSIRSQRMIAALLGAFAALALVMSFSGVYAVVAYVTSRRTKEIALRRAIGAQGADVLELLVGPTFRWSAAGLVVGIAGAVAGSAMLQRVVGGLVPLDAKTVLPVCALYLAVIAFAMVMPAIRALKLDPAEVLRAE